MKQRHWMIAIAGVATVVSTCSVRVARADDMTCDSCESCTSKLATPGARVALGKSIQQEHADACIVIRGQGAQLDGLEHAVKLGAGATAVRVEAAGVLVKNLHVGGGAVGIDVASAGQTTVFHAWIADSSVGIRVTAAHEVRITRSVVRASRVGISFGANEDGTCSSGLTVSSPGAVVAGTRVEGAQVGIAACDAYPVLARNEVAGNRVGVLLAGPRAGAGAAAGSQGPYDPCACAPLIDGVKPGTTLLFSSGCGGCQVHEGWLPELRKSKHDIVVRETGPAKGDAMARFDAFMDRCAPEVTDAIGIPGCVPNYTCLANGVTFKTRRGDSDLVFETQISTPEEAAAYAKACRDAAQRYYGSGKSCVSHALMANVMCGNMEADIRAMQGSALDGIDDACDRADGFGDTGAKGCAKPCPPTVPPAAEPPPRADREASGAAPQPMASAALAPDAASTAGASTPVAPRGAARSAGRPWDAWLVGLAGVALVGISVGLLFKRGKPR
jgi:hypothetical protein